MTSPVTGETGDNPAAHSTTDTETQLYSGFMAQQSNYGYQFTAPYAPEQGDFQPVPIGMQIAFVPVATGPPFSVGDDIEAMRRREMERTQPMPAYQAPVIAPPATTYNAYPPANTYVAGSVHNSMLDTVLAIMQPTAEMVEYSNNFTHIQVSTQASAVPISYIREKIPQFYRPLYLNEQSATHMLQLTSINQETAMMPAHDLVLVAQCLAIRNVASFQQIIPGMAKPALVIQNVPHLQSFGLLFRWLYTNDQDELYESLAASRVNGPETIFGFAQNCKFWGALDPRILGVLRGLLEAS